jgi:thiol-disulfide isomerase/thioredoxin
MAATESRMLALGTALPAFTLPDVAFARKVSSDALQGARGVLVMFICNHCPYVIHIRPKLVEVAHRALDAGFAVVAINSNSVLTHPQDGPGPMRQLATSEGWRFPFCFDETQAVAHAFGAACTPDLFLFDAARRLAYRGQFDDARPGKPVPVTGRDLQAALDAVAAGAAPGEKQVPSIGCNIKWHPG